VKVRNRKWWGLLGASLWVGCNSYLPDLPEDELVPAGPGRAPVHESPTSTTPPDTTLAVVPPTDITPPVIVTPPTPGFVFLALGYGEAADHYAHSCGIDGVGDLRCWGANQYGQLGTGDNISRGGSLSDAIPRIALPGRVRRVGAGTNFTCAMLDDGTVRCFGRYTTASYSGYLGTGERLVLGDQPGEMAALKPIDFGYGRKADELFVGPNHACIIAQTTREILCWGGGPYGELGNGKNIDIGDDPGEMGVALIPVDTGTRSPPMELALGLAHTCARFNDGRVKCWGYNAHGELGLGDVTSRGTTLPTLGMALPFVDLGTGKRAVRITAGSFHTCAILDDGGAKCWGYNGYGQLGYEHVRAIGASPSQMGGYLANVDLGVGSSQIATITAGDWHTCASLRDGRVKCWGSANAGRLGTGDGLARGATPGTMGLNLPNVDLGTDAKAISVTTGMSHTCAILADHTTKCWGYNILGQLGVGDTVMRGNSRSEMGDALPTVRYP